MAIDAKPLALGIVADGLEKFIARLKLRTALPAADIEAIRSLSGEVKQVDAHRDIIRPGERSEHATLVVDGLVGRFDQLANGNRQITALHIAGDMCDLHSVAVPHAGWGIQALAKSTIVNFRHSEVLKLYHDRPTIALAFWRDTIVDASILAKWISALGQREAPARLAHLVCELGIRSETAGLGTRRQFQLPVTQGQLAEVLGVTPVHINRSLQGLRGAGVLKMEGSLIRVPDVAALWKVADFDPAYLLLEPV